VAESEKNRLQKQLEERCRDALCGRGLGDDRVSYAVQRSGAVAPAIVQFAEEHDADLVVMGTHGRRGVTRLVFGSVAEEVLRTAPCPVLTVRTAAEEEEGDRPTPASVKRLVAPVDFSDASRSALQYAARLATVYDAPLTLTHVVDLPKIPTIYEAEFDDLSPKEVAATVEAELGAWGRSVAGEGVDPSIVVEAGEPVATLLDCASTPNDLLVMATHGLSGAKRRLLGSVAEGVLRRAPGPVITSRTFPKP
jgi:nucleotide-binding universal stress UspA family protein